MPFPGDISAVPASPPVRRSRDRALLALAVVSLALLGSLALARRADAVVYWTNTLAGTIGRAQDNGADPEQSFITGLESPTGVAVYGEYIYWTEPFSDPGVGGGSIGRARVHDGEVSEVEPKFINKELIEPWGIAISGGRIYWAEKEGRQIGYANLNGTEIHEAAFSTSPVYPAMITVNGDQLLYTSGQGIVETENEIGRIDLETDAEETVYNNSEPFNKIYALAVDSGHLYWSACHDGPGEIGWVGESGADPEPSLLVVLNALEFGPLGCATGLAVGDGHLYWSMGYGAGQIARSNLNGGEVEPELITGGDEPTDLTVTESPSLSGDASAATSLGGEVSDSANLEGAAEPTGTLTYRLYGPADSTCSGSPVYSAEVPVTGNGAYRSPSFTPTAAGTYHWTVSYSGDGRNEPVFAGCNASGQSVTVAAPPVTVLPTPTRTPAALCTTQRLERIHWRLARGLRLARIIVRVDGHVYRRLSGAARKVTLSLKGRPGERVIVTVLGTTRSGARYETRRSFDPCAPARPAHASAGGYLRRV